LECEGLIIQALNFNLSVPTSFIFAQLLGSSSDERTKMYVSYIIELCLLDYKMLIYAPNLVAASAYYIANRILKNVLYKLDISLFDH